MLPKSVRPTSVQPSRARPARPDTEKPYFSWSRPTVQPSGGTSFYIYFLFSLYLTSPSIVLFFLAREGKELGWTVGRTYIFIGFSVLDPSGPSRDGGWL
jgi:hypothetical protein